MSKQKAQSEQHIKRCNSKGMESGRLERLVGFSEGLAVAGFVVLAGVVVVDPLALGLLAVDVDVLLGRLVPAEEGGSHLF